MSLHGSTIEIQNAIVQLYLKLEQRFSENGLIRELWKAMAHDVSQQIVSLKAFPASFWTHLTQDSGVSLEEEIRKARLQGDEKTEDLSLGKCFELAIRIEEPTILRIYAPIIHSLRKNWTNTALDFYIMVKSHIARIARVTESYSGDPIAIQHSHLLLQSFEKEVQEHRDAAKVVEDRKQSSKYANAKKPAKKVKKAEKHSGPLAKHGSIRRSRTKPLVKKIDIPRRRARR